MKHIYKLNNGVKVIIVPLDTKLTSVSLSIKLGIIHEKKNEMGLTHYMEHLMARMTSQKYPDNKYVSQELSKRGAFVNAYVDDYETKFYIQGLFKDVDFYLDVIANGIFNFHLIGEIAEKEKQSVIHEMQQQMSKNKYMFEYKINKYFYPKYSYHYHYKDYIELLKKYDISKITDYIRKHISLKNTTVSVSCPLDGVEKAKKLIKKHFEDKVQKHIVKLKYPNLIHVNKGLKIIHVSRAKDDDSVLFRVYVNKPIEYLSKQYLCLMIFQNLLCNFQAGVLYNVLRKQYGLIYSVNMMVNINFHNYKSSSYNIETATNVANVPTFIHHFLNIMKTYTFRDEDIENTKNNIYIKMENRRFYTLTSINEKYEKFLLHNKPTADEEVEILRLYKSLKMSYIKKMLKKFQTEILENGIVFYYSNEDLNKKIKNILGSSWNYKLLSI